MDEMKDFYKSIAQEDRFNYIKDKIDNNAVLKEVLVALNKRKWRFK